MSLTPSQRMALEASINSAISNISNILDNWDQVSAIKKYQIENINEFLYGHTVGMITNAFNNIIFISEGAVTTREQAKEAEEIISRRLHEIRNAIVRERYYHQRIR